MKRWTKYVAVGIGVLLISASLWVVQGAAARPEVAQEGEASESQSKTSAPSRTLLSYQGQLGDREGSPIDGNVDMTFSFYHQAEGGTAFWTEAHTGANSIPVNQGQFHVVLGSLVAINPADLSGGVYLEVVVKGETLAPRELLTSVAFAVEARGVSAPLDVHGYIASRGNSGGQVSAFNPNNQAAAVHLGWADDVARIRIGGSGAGSSGGFDIQAIGNRSLLRVLNNGDLQIGGSVSCGAVVESGLQTEEDLAAESIDRFQEGDLLCWGVDQLEPCSRANDRLVQAVADPQGRPIVLGAEVVKVLGPVQRGDILVASDVPGYAMVNNDPVSGSVIPQALEDFDEERGLIKAMIRKF